MTKASDFIARHLADLGFRHVFMITGGGAMHLNDSFGREGRLRYVCNNHEQACAIAAEGYARLSGTTGLVNVTTGPGGTNTLTGVLGQWLDSIPVIYVSGQVRYAMTAVSTGLPLRQLGDQEADIVTLVKPITKYAQMVTDPLTTGYHLDRALALAAAGRPGPVWLDFPLDVQAAMVDEAKMKRYDPAEDTRPFDRDAIERAAALVMERLRRAERPLLFGGAGIRLSHGADAFRRVADRLGIPVQLAWNAIDLLPSSHPLNFGRPSTLGQRAANFIFQNCDMLVSVGCRMNARQIGYNHPSVARAAFKVSVDVDEAELAKPTFEPDLPLALDARLFLEALERVAAGGPPAPKQPWLDWCAERRLRYPPVLPAMREDRGAVNPYFFCETLSGLLSEGDVVVSSNGASCVVPIQALALKPGQRHLVNSGCAAMGFGLPAAVGACCANEGRRVICLEGDGSIELNVHELATVARHKLPLKVFVFSNNGYLSIRGTQRTFFEGRMVGESVASGLALPDIAAVARAYGLEAFAVRTHAELGPAIARALESDGPVLCDVRMDPEQQFEPRVTSKRLADGRMVSSPLEEMHPFLDRAEFLSNMLIPAWEPEPEEAS